MVDGAPSAVGGRQTVRRQRAILDGAAQNRRAVLSRAPTLRRRPPVGCYIGTVAIFLSVKFCEVNHEHLDFAVHFYFVPSRRPF